MKKPSLKSSPSDTTISLLAAARQALKRSYSPYSGFSVAAAVRTNDGRVFSGCNVENSSFGATVCAERVAIFKAVSEGASKITEVLVLTETERPWPPCGICRQVLSEFAAPAVLVTFTNGRGVERSMALEDLLPEAFGPSFIAKKGT